MYTKRGSFVPVRIKTPQRMEQEGSTNTQAAHLLADAWTLVLLLLLVEADPIFLLLAPRCYFEDADKAAVNHDRPKRQVD